MFVVLLPVPPHTGDPYVLLGQLLAAVVIVGAVGLVLTAVRRGLGRVSRG